MEKDNSGAKPKQAYPKIPSSLSLQAHFSEKKGEVLVTPKKNGSRLSMYAAPVSFASPQAKVSHGFSATTFYGRGMSHGITPSPSESSDCKAADIILASCVENGCLQFDDLDGFVYVVEFKRSSRCFLRSKSSTAEGLPLKPGEVVIVEADRGFDCGVLVSQTRILEFVELAATTTAGGARITHSNKRLERSATEEEISQLSAKRKVEDKAVEFIKNLCQLRSMPLNILDAEFQFDHAKLTIYFEATSYVHFHSLVREIYKVYKTRIWLEQVGSNDNDFAQVEASAKGAGSSFLSPVADSSFSRFPVVTPEYVSTGSATDKKSPDAFSPPSFKWTSPGHFSPMFVCPITQDIMVDPVTCSDGMNYERGAIIAWLQRHRTSPSTRKQLPNKGLAPNHALRTSIQTFRAQRLEERVSELEAEFASEVRE